MATKKRKKQLKDLKKKRSIKSASTYIIQPKDVCTDVPMINREAWLTGIKNRDQSVFQAIVEYMMFFERHHYRMFGSISIKKINEFIQMTYTALSDENFIPDSHRAWLMLQVAHIFHHLVAISGFETNDAALKNTLFIQNNITKILFLQNSRCEFQMDQKRLFDASPEMASLWYLSYMCGISCPTKLTQQNLYRHLECMDERFKIVGHRLTSLYFTCTYHNPGSARRVKSIINKAVKEAGTPDIFRAAGPQIHPNKHVAIVTNKWHRNHAVYKSAGPLVEQLRDKYRLTLLWTGEKFPSTIVKDYFESVHQCYFLHDGRLVLPDALKVHDFDMVYFPDIGMSDESIWLSNTRIAPIQAVGYGHPDTTGDGSEIDYFICGDVEKEADAAYSETRVCIPGLAQEPAWPTAERKYNYLDDGVVRVNCVWGPDKYNHTLLTMLAEINNEVVRRRNEGTIYDAKAPQHEFHLFGSPGLNRYAALPIFTKDVCGLIPNAIIHSEQEYYDYMENAEQHDFSLNSFPFGCYNVLIESLYMGLPFLTLVGDRFYNRAGMWLNDQIDMPFNNFTSPREMINFAARLIVEPELLANQREQLAAIDLKERLFTLKGDYFLRAIDYIFENHPFTETKIIGDD